MVAKKDLRGLLRDRGVTPSEIAQITGNSPQTVNNWLKRNSVPKEYIFQVSELLDVSPDQLGHTPEGWDKFIGVGQKLPVIGYPEMLKWVAKGKHYHPVAYYWTAQFSLMDHKDAGAFCVEMDNKSMEPFIPQSALLYIVTNIKEHDQRQCLIHQISNNQLYVAQYMTHGAQVILKFANPDYTNIELPAKDVGVLGVIQCVVM